MKSSIKKAQMSFLGYERIKREERAKELEEPIQLSYNLFAVLSSKGVKSYSVRKVGDKWICDCPDYRFYKEEQECKHIIKVKKYLQEIEKHTEEARAKTQSRQREVIADRDFYG